MPVVDLSTRLTTKEDDYYHHSKSSDSLVLSMGIDPKLDAPSSLDLTVGDRYIDLPTQKEFAIDEKGYKLLPKSSVVIYSKQTIGVPLNVFGIITGTGKNIYRGCFVGSGKINPGFYGQLRISVFNGSSEPWVFKHGNILASCTFFEIETHLNNPFRNYDVTTPEVKKKTNLEKFIKWLATNWFSLLTLAIAVLSLFFRRRT